jgi:nucleoid-associated protein YgaU
MFDPESRYANVADSKTTDDAGRPVVVKRIRFISTPPATITHVVTEPDRPDLLAHRYYQAPDLFWRIADANEVRDPADLCRESGTVLRIPART